MPADRPGIGMGRRRQGDTEPDRSDDSNRSLDRAIDTDRTGGNEEAYERGKAAGARGADTPHEDIQPGVKRDLDGTGDTA